MAITSQGNDALREELSQRSIESLQGSLDSDRAMARIVESTARFQSNMPERAEYLRQLGAEVAAHKSAVEAELASRGVGVDADMRERTTERTQAPANQLSNAEIVSEVHGLHAQFEQLSERYNSAPASEREQLRGEMKPVVERENSLREAYAGRATQEVNQEVNRDRAHEAEIGFSR